MLGYHTGALGNSYFQNFHKIHKKARKTTLEVMPFIGYVFL